MKRTVFSKESYLEEAILPRIVTLCTSLGISPPKRNQKYLYPTALEFDFSWLEYKIAVEVNGGIDKPGRRSGHVSRNGIRRDYYKSNLAQLQGWILLTFPPEYCLDSVQWPMAQKFLKNAFKLRSKLV